LADSSALVEAPWTYLAILKGKQGEYAALGDLDPATRAKVTPLFQLRSNKGDEAAVAELASAMKDLRTGWDPEGPVLLDGEWMASAESGLWRALDAVHAHGRPALPVTGTGRSNEYQRSVKRAVETWHEGVVVRLGRGDFSRSEGIADLLGRLLSDLGVVPAQVDLILDFRSLQEAHLAADEIAAIGMLNQVPYIGEWRHLAITGTGMPASVSAFPRNQITPLRRLEWWLYQGLRSQRHGIPRLPTFGDYGITNPDQVENSIDPKFMRPTAHLRYATENDWLIVKTRTIDSGGIDALPELFRALVERPEYQCVSTSSADRWVEQVSQGKVTPGNTTTWRQHGTGRHLTVATRQLSNQAAA
jgi:hypothetical protein